MATAETMTTEAYLTDFDAHAARIRRDLEGDDEALEVHDAEVREARAMIVAELERLDAEEAEGPAEFSTGLVEFCTPGAPCAERGGVFRRKGVIFRAGSFPEKDYHVTPAELAELARDFRGPIPVDHGHPVARGPLDDDMGNLVAVELSPDGRALVGTVDFPEWIERKLGDARRFVSASFDRMTRRIRRLSLVTNPHFTDAELHAAFSASATAPVSQAKINELLACTATGRLALAEMNGPAEFSTAVAEPPAAPTPLAFQGLNDYGIARLLERQPIRVTEAEESGLLTAALEADAPGLRAAVDRRIDSLESHAQTDVRLATINRIDVRPALRQAGDELARLRATRVALETSDPAEGVAYARPTPAEVLDARGLVAARAYLKGGVALSELLGRARHHRPEDGPTEAESLSYAVAELLGGGVSEEGHQFAHKALLRAAESRALRGEVDALLGGETLGRALGAAVARAVVKAGGREAVARDLAALLAIDPAPVDPIAGRIEMLRASLGAVRAQPPSPERDAEDKQIEDSLDRMFRLERERGAFVPPPKVTPPDEAERAQVEADLAGAGAAPDSPEPGRLVAGLQRRHRELTEAIARRRAEARDRTAAEAAALVDGALAGEVEAFESLSREARRNEKAFAPGFGDALEAAPLEALRSMPTGGFAALVVA